MPTRFRQRLFLGGNSLDDSVKLDSATELELVLLTYTAASQMQANKLVTYSLSGLMSEVPNPSRVSGYRLSV